MGKIRFSPATIKAGFLVENPDWYDYEIVKHMEKAATTGSVNHILIFEGRSGEMDGVPVSKLINEKADWVALPIFVAANGGNPPDPESDYDWDDLVGVRMSVFTKRGARQDGTPQNDLVEFKPLGK